MRTSLLATSLCGALALSACGARSGIGTYQAPTSKTDAGHDAQLADASVDTRRRDAHPPEELLTNERPCKIERGSLHPPPDAPDHWAAVRLTAPRSPFTVTRLRYTLLAADEAYCSATLAHRVSVHRSSGHAPLEYPDLMVVEVPAAPGSAKERVVEVDLPAPFVLQGGAQLFVAVELTGDATGSKLLCLGACKGNSTADRNYWSEATSAPYEWTQLTHYGLNLNLIIEAFGY